MQGLFDLYDTVLCVAILLVSCDYLRAVYFFDQPVISTAIAITAVGSFGLVLYIFSGWNPPGWAILLHTSIGIFVGYHYKTAVLREPMSLMRERVG